MAQITALISGPNKNFDYQVTALARSILNQGVLSSTDLLVSTNSVAAGEAFLLCTRTNGQKIMVHFQNTAAVTIDTSGTKKVWVGISQAVIDDGSSNAIDGTGIATIQTGAAYPSTGAYIPLASVASSVITDARTVISRKALLDSGYAIGYIKEIDPTTGNEVMRGLVTGSAILSTETLRKKKADGNYEDIAFSAIQSALAPQNFAYQSALYPIEDLLANDVIFEYYHPTVAQAINGYFNVGDVAGNTIVTLARRISSGVSGNSITIRTDKVTATANFGIRIVTCDASGVPTTTLVDANAVQFVAPASVSASGSNTVITFPASFTCGTIGSLVAIQVCQGTSFASTTVNAAQYYKVGMATGITNLATEIQATANAGGSLVGGGTYSLSQTFTALRRCQITKIEFGYQAAIGMNITISSGGRSWTKTLTVAATLVTLDAPFSVESGKTVVISGSGASWSNWNAVTGAVTASADITATDGNGPGFVRLYSLFSLDLPCTLSMTMDGFVKKSRAMDILYSYFGGICLANTSKGTKPSLLNGFIPLFSALSKIAYFVSTTAGLISGTDNGGTVGFGVSPTILDTAKNNNFRNSGAPRSLDGENYFGGGNLRYALATAASSSATLKWTGDLVNPNWITIDTLGASVSVDRNVSLPKGYIQLTYTGTVSTNSFYL